MESGKIPLDNTTPRRNPRRSCVKRLSFKLEDESENNNDPDWNESPSTSMTCYTKKKTSKCPENSTAVSKTTKIRPPLKGSSKMLKNSKCHVKTTGSSRVINIAPPPKGTNKMLRKIKCSGKATGRSKIIKIRLPPRGSSQKLKKYWQDYEADNDAFIHDRMKINFHKKNLRANIIKFMKISGLPRVVILKENPSGQKSRSERKSSISNKRKPSKASNCTSQNTRKNSKTNKALLQSEDPSVIHPYAERPSYSMKVLSEEMLRAMLQTREIVKRVEARKKMYEESILKQESDNKYVHTRSVKTLNNELASFVDASKKIVLNSLGSAATSSLQSAEVGNKIPLTGVIATTSSTMQSSVADSTTSTDGASTSNTPQNVEIGDMVPFTGFKITGGELFCSTGSGTTIIRRQPSDGSQVLRDVVAYVDMICRGDEDISVDIMKKLLRLGAAVTLTFNKSDPVTHILFNDGHVSTYKKAKKRNIPLVSVLWIEESCRIGTKAPSADFPPLRMERYECPKALRALKKRKFLYVERKVPRKVRKSRKTINIVQETPQTENKSSFEFTPSTGIRGPAWIYDIPGVTRIMRTTVNLGNISEEEFREMLNEPAGSEKYMFSPLPMRLLYKMTRKLAKSYAITSSSEKKSSISNGTHSNDSQILATSNTIITSDTHIAESSIDQKEKQKCETGSHCSEVIRIVDISKQKKLNSVNNNIDSERELRGVRRKRVLGKARLSKTI